MGVVRRDALGQPGHGNLGDRFGYAPVVAWSGVAYVAVALAVLLSRSVRTHPRARSATTVTATVTA